MLVTITSLSDVVLRHFCSSNNRGEIVFSSFMRSFVRQPGSRRRYSRAYVAPYICANRVLFFSVSSAFICASASSAWMLFLLLLLLS